MGGGTEWIQWLGASALTVILAVLGWLERRISALWKANEKHQQDLAEHRETVAKEYVTRAELQHTVSETRSDIAAGFDRLSKDINDLRKELHNKEDKR